MKKHSNIPIFIPELACPHQCIFCNQRKISGQIYVPPPESIANTINEYLQSMNDGRTVEVAFFGGSFTGISIDLQEQYLKAAQPFIKEGLINGIRLSTRPDYIDIERLDMLKKYSVVAIELGAQSTSTEVLQKSGRGHTFNHIEQASKLINSYDIELGLQMMVGLPTDTKERTLQTAKDIVQLGARTTRIYPTVVVKDTALESMYNDGKYTPLTLKSAADWCKEPLLHFDENNVKVLRVGLHPSEELVEGKDLIAGPMHPSFKEMVKTEIWSDKLLLKFSSLKKAFYNISVAPEQINFAIGYQSKNKNYLKSLGYKIKFSGDKNLHGYESKISIC